MRSSRTQTLILLGLVIGVVAGMALAATFDPGDAAKVSDGVTLQAPNDRVAVTLHGTTNVTLDDAFPNSTTHSSQFADRSVMLNTTDGNITLASDNAVSASVHTSNMTGTWTNATEITAGGNWVEIYPSDKQRVDVRGDADQLSIASAALDDGNADIWIEGTDGGTGSVKYYTLLANTQIVAVDSSGAYLDHATTNANGNVTFDIPLSSHTVFLQDASTTKTPQYSNAEPQGIVSDTPDKLSVDVSDGDFPSDDVEVNISLDGSQIHSENITSNGTVTTSNFGTLDLGEHTWTVNSTDAYGNFKSTEYTFELPSNITIRNETNASQIIKDKNVTATFYSDNGEIVVERSDSNEDGNISLRGLPDTEFVVTFSGPGWYDRRAYIESIGNQQNIYLLNSTAFQTSDDSAIETTFIYEDRTDQFDRESTTLRIERAVDPDNDDNYTWKTIAGDYWGAAGEFPFTGQYQERYRLKIKNQATGKSRILGTHIPTDDGVKNIIVGNIVFEAENATGRFYDAGINQNTTNLQIYYQDPTNQTTDLNVTIYHQGNESNQVYNETIAGPIGEETIIVDLSENQTEENLIVQFEGERNGNAFVDTVIVGGAEYPLQMDPSILAGFSFAMVTFVMLLYGPRTAIFGAWAGVMAFAGLMFVGWLSWSIPALMIAVIAAGGGTFYQEAMPG